MQTHTHTHTQYNKYKKKDNPFKLPTSPSTKSPKAKKQGSHIPAVEPHWKADETSDPVEFQNNQIIR